ncbi:MAG: hypothetical protein IT204_02385 [Fimbriimonadaceae bacterium]|nr:hypothetical protein [Fimbriimonadaceae bacterium]
MSHSELPSALVSSDLATRLFAAVATLDPGDYERVGANCLLGLGGHPCRLWHLNLRRDCLELPTARPLVFTLGTWFEVALARVAQYHKLPGKEAAARSLPRLVRRLTKRKLLQGDLPKLLTALADLLDRYRANPLADLADWDPRVVPQVPRCGVNLDLPRPPRRALHLLLLRCTGLAAWDLLLQQHRWLYLPDKVKSRR